MGLNVIVMLDGQELDGATVTLEPEKFLGPNLAEASGVSSAHGMTPLRTKDKPGVHLGLYKVLVSKVIDGKETIPAKFNTAATIGIEVAPTGTAGPPPVVPTFKLTSK